MAADWTSARIVELLRAGSGLPDLAPTIQSVLPFTMAGQVASALRAGPAFLVGDAAHRTTPMGGVGMNTAVHAAHNLGWKLAWVLRGWAADALLDSYAEERLPVGANNVRRSLDTEAHTPADGLRHDIGVRYRSAVLDPDAGERAPHAWVRHGGTRISTLDLFDGRLTVLTGPAGSGVAAGRGPAGRRRTADHRVDRRHRPAARGRLVRRGATGSAPAGAVLVRPDGFVSWRHDGAAADPAAELDAALARTLGRARPARPDLPVAPARSARPPHPSRPAPRPCRPAA